MVPYFIVFDVDGTLVHEHTRCLLPNVAETIRCLESEGHIMCVCSNNPTVERLLVELGLRDCFKFVVQRPSMTLKSVELFECWTKFMNLYKQGVYRSKPRLKTMVFVDDDPEILENVKLIFQGITCVSSVSELKDSLDSVPSATGISRSEVLKRIRKVHGRTLIP
jgi:FMN phosphatase YigB (HAD superfamily)